MLLGALTAGGTFLSYAHGVSRIRSLDTAGLSIMLGGRIDGVPPVRCWWTGVMPSAARPQPRPRLERIRFRFWRQVTRYPVAVLTAPARHAGPFGAPAFAFDYNLLNLQATGKSR